MANINEILARAAALRDETALNSISPERAGGIMYDTLMALNELWLQQGAALVISKIYASVDAMEADTAPVSDISGKPLRSGQIVVIASEDEDNGSVYRYNGTDSPSWSLVGNIGNLEPVDSLDSDSTQLPLAAHQGKVLDDKVSQLGQELTQVIPKKAGVNLLDTASPNIIPGKYLNSSGVVSGGTAAYAISDYIPVIAGGTYTLSNLNGGYPGGSGYVAFYNESKEIVGSPVNTTTFTIPVGASFLRCSLNSNYTTSVMLNAGANRAVYEAYNPVEGYLAKVFSESLDLRLKDSQKAKESCGKNLLDIDAVGVIIGKYLNSNGIESIGTSAYRISDYIKIEPNVAYHLSNSADSYIGGSAGYVVFYDKDGTIVGSPVNTTQFTTPSTAKFLRCTIHSDSSADAMLNKGTDRGDYEAFNPIAGYGVSLFIPDKSIVASKMSDNSGIKQFNGIVGMPTLIKAQASLADGNSITATDYPYYIKNNDNIVFEGKISTFDTLLVGRGYHSYLGVWLKIDTTNVYVIRYSGGVEEILNTQAHGLTISTFIKVVYSFTEDGKLVYIIQSLGGYFRYEATTLWGGMGSVFVTADGMNLTDCKVSVSNKELKKQIWCYGDSYFSLNNTRWTHYLRNWGYKNYVLDALSGGNSSQLINDFEQSLKYGCPKFAFWALGMNDGGDTNADTPSSSWLTNIQSFISICVQNGIIPILATIPTVPSTNNEGKTKWVRNSGCRYVDFYKAVGANASGEWYSGYLSSDNVHPDQLGAQALATQLLVDFPEIME